MIEPISDSDSDGDDYSSSAEEIDESSDSSDDMQKDLLINKVVEHDDSSDLVEDNPKIDDDTSEVLWKGNMSLKELIALREKIGLKKFNKDVFSSEKSNSPAQKQKNTKKTFKREYRRRPQEISSKRKVPMLRKVVSSSKSKPRDPRFDDLCGSHFDEQTFNKRFSFLDDIRERERTKLRKALSETDDPSKKEELRYLLRRMKQQKQAKQHRTIMREVEEEYKKDELEKVGKGIKKPHYLTKKKRKELFEKKKLELWQQQGNQKKAEILNEKKLLRKERKHMPRKRRTDNV